MFLHVMVSDFRISLFTWMFSNTSQRKQERDDKTQRKQERDDKNCGYSTAQLCEKKSVVQILASFSKTQGWTLVGGYPKMYLAVKPMSLADHLQEMSLFI